MKSFEAGYDDCLATVAEMLTAEGMDEAASLLRTAECRIAETGYDNWNGGTTIWTIYLTVPPAMFARLSANRQAIEAQINERLKSVLEQFTHDWCSVSFAPLVEPKPDWRDAKNGLSQETRQNIIDGLKIDKVAFSGRLGEVEFLERIFDLKSLPSHDSRFEDAAGDIWQHRVNNFDWDDDWVYGDSRGRDMAIRIAQAKESLRIGFDQSLLNAERLRKPGRQVRRAVMMVVEHREHFAFAGKPRGLAVGDALVRLGQRETYFA